MPPGCTLYVQDILAVVGGVTGTGNGMGKVVIPVPIPSGVKTGTKVYRQWLLVNQAPVNAAKFTMSNVRHIEIK